MDNRDPGDVLLVNPKDFEQYQKLFGPAAQTASAGETIVIDSLPNLMSIKTSGSRHWNSGLNDEQRKQKRAAKKAERNRKRDQRRKQRR